MMVNWLMRRSVLLNGGGRDAIGLSQRTSPRALMRSHSNGLIATKYKSETIELRPGMP